MYVSELQALAQWCNFVDSIENMLRDQEDTGGSWPGATRQIKQQTKKYSGEKNNVKTVEPTDSTNTEEYPLYQLTETSGSKPKK